jgi:hypothetical protein
VLSSLSMFFSGKDDANGNKVTTFGVLFKDDKVANTLESLAGTLKAAKKKGIVSGTPQAWSLWRIGLCASSSTAICVVVCYLSAELQARVAPARHVGQ